MGRLLKIPKILNKILDSLVAIFIMLIIMYSSFSLYTSYKLFREGVTSSDLLAIKPDPENTDLKLSFEQLREINKDVCAWVTIDNTKIDHPIVQGKDNFEYLNKDVYGKFSYGGSIFLDERNSIDFKDPYSLVYGHHMEHHAMFGDLDKFKDEKFFDENKSGDLITEEKKYKFEIFAVVRADGYDEHIFNPTATRNYEEAKDLIEYIKTKKIHYRQVDLKENHRIVALSTCQTSNTNSRLILFGLIKLD